MSLLAEASALPDALDTRAPLRTVMECNGLEIGLGPSYTGQVSLHLMFFGSAVQ